MAKPLNDVIGLSGSVRIQYTIQFDQIGEPVPIMRLGNEIELVLKPFAPKLVGVFVYEQSASAFLRIKQEEIFLGIIVFRFFLVPPDLIGPFTDIKFTWHTSGQARLMQDGKLIGYQNNAAPGVSVQIDNVVFGIPDAPPEFHPSYMIGRVFVRALREQDWITEFSKFYPVIPFSDPEDFETCQLLPINNLIGMAYRLRHFMSVFHQQSSQPWTSTSGPAEGPFKPEAIAAHEFAIRAGAEFARMMRTSDFSSPDAFLESFEKFLVILRDARGGDFTELVHEIINNPPVPADPAECTAIIESIREEHKEALGPMIDVLSIANDRVKDIAGGF